MSEILPYAEAVAEVRRVLQEPRLATSIRRILSCRIVDKVYGAGKAAIPRPHHEREAALHIRKMIAEGEVSEEMRGKRLYYKLPTTEHNT